MDMFVRHTIFEVAYELPQRRHKLCQRAGIGFRVSIYSSRSAVQWKRAESLVR